MGSISTRAPISINKEIDESWTEEIKQNWQENKAEIEAGLITQYGQDHAAKKRQNFTDLGMKPISILAFHNAFLDQVRVAFVVDSYYPALTGACALGERILNHLVLRLRDHFKATPEYKRVYRKESFDNWGLAIDTLESWDVLRSETAEAFRELEGKGMARITSIRRLITTTAR